MAYSYRCHSNTGPMKLNRTSWGPVTTPTQIELPNKIFGRPLSGNFDRIINSFDRTNAFECVRSAFEHASQNKVGVELNLQEADEVVKPPAKSTLINRSSAIFEKPPEEKERFYACGEVVVNGRTADNHVGSSYERADVGLASKQTPCTDEEVTEYYRDRLYMSQARQLFPLQEDLADWINKTIGIDHLTGENFLNVLDNGVELCQLATIIRDKAKEAADKGIYHGPIPQVRGRCWQRAARRSFFSRDNMENFITFCRQLGVHENLLFESDDLVLHAQPRNVILCLLELARIATKFKVEPPGLVQLEREIALEEAGVTEDKDVRLGATLGWQFQQESVTDGADKITDANLDNSSVIDTEVSLPVALYTTESEDNKSVHTDDTWSRGTSEDLDGVPLKPLSELDKRVQIVTRLMQRNCNCAEGKCSKLLKVKKVGEGRYNIAGRNVFIRLLKGRHMMVRVGGGWDTLEHFLTRHDPCQVRVISSHSASAIPKVTTVDLVQQPQKLTAEAIENAIIDSIEAQCNNNYSNDTVDNPRNGVITPTNESISETSSVNSTSFINTPPKQANGKVSPNSGKSTPNSIRSCSASSKYSVSGRVTPQSTGKTSPRNLKSPTYNKSLSLDLKSQANGKISPTSLKLDLTAPLNNRRIKSASVINNRMISPIESSTRLLPANAKNNATKAVKTPTAEGRKSFPSAIGVDNNNMTRRRSLNLSLPSANTKFVKAPIRSKTQYLKSPIKSPVAHTPPLVSPSIMEKGIKMPLQTSTPNKSFLHIRAKYRSPPPRDVPPR